MNKLYSKNALIIKAASCFMLSPLYLLIESLSIFYMLAHLVILVGCLYTIPFWLSASYLKKFRVKSIKKYILFDFLACYVPAFLGTLCTEVVYTIVTADTSFAGIYTVIFSIIFLFISLLFWFLYVILSRKK